jgi:hypothetical protein
MSRETKVGLVVALSFLLLVGGVLGYKLYFTDDPLLGMSPQGPGGQAENQNTQPESETGKDSTANPFDEKPVKEHDPEKAKPTESALAKSGVPMTGRPESRPAPKEAKNKPEEKPGVAESRPDPRPGLPPTEEPAKPTEKPVASGPTLPPLPPTEQPERPSTNVATGPMPPAPEDTPKLGPPPADEPINPRPAAAERPMAGTPMLPPPAEEPAKPNTKPAEVELPLPSLPEKPITGSPALPPPEEAVKPPTEKPGSPPPLPPIEEPTRPPAMPAEKPMVSLPASPPPPAAQVKPNPMAPPPVDIAPRLTPPAGSSPLPPADVPTPPSPNTFERKYDVPALGKPVADSGARAPAAGTPVSRLPDNQSGIPLTVRPQPGGKPRNDAGGVPVVIQPPTWNTADGRAPAQVESFDMEVYILKPGDTYASISQLRYRSDRYQGALAQFNRERDPRLATPQPGMTVYLPPAGYLERRFGVPNPAPDTSTGIKSAVVRPPASETSRAGGSGRDFQPTSARLDGTAPPANDTKPAAQADWAQSSSTKRYRVRPNDTIWSIAKSTLGHGERWPDILKLNRDVLRDVNQLQAGMVLKMPGDARVDASETPP